MQAADVDPDPEVEIPGECVMGVIVATFIALLQWQLNPTESGAQ